MSVRVDPKLRHEVAAFSEGGNFDECFHCGNCTAVCTLSKDRTVFPRQIIRRVQLGLRSELDGSTEPWLCYYCGQCAETCPRDARPAELMMAARRYLTSRYDVTGLSRRLYLSKAWEIGLLAVLGLAVVALFWIWGAFSPERMPLETVSVNTFASVALVHYADWALAGFLGLFLFLGGVRMWRMVAAREATRSIPASVYVRELGSFLRHFTTQPRWRQCGERRTTLRWAKHLVLMIGYATMLLLVVVFLPWFQRDGAEFHFTALFGYYATAFLLYYTVEAMIGRWRKREHLHRISHFTDWTFLVLLFLTSLTGIVLHAFRLLDLPMPTYVAYVVHLAVAVPMLIVEVPFGKWAHLLYRPLAAYLQRVEVRAGAAVETVPGIGSA